MSEFGSGVVVTGRRSRSIGSTPCKHTSFSLSAGSYTSTLGDIPEGEEIEGHIEIELAEDHTDG